MIMVMLTSLPRSYGLLLSSYSMPYIATSVTNKLIVTLATQEYMNGECVAALLWRRVA